MLGKKCPWCNEKISISQLGSRPAKPLPKWYQFSRNIRVCPYCAGAVKPGGKGLWFLVLCAPLFISYAIEIFMGINPYVVKYMQESVWVLFLVGMLLTYWVGGFEKNEGV